MHFLIEFFLTWKPYYKSLNIILTVKHCKENTVKKFTIIFPKQELIKLVLWFNTHRLCLNLNFGKIYVL